MNAVLTAAHRTVNWFSFTVPQGRGDEDYFAPLSDLRLGRRPSCTSRSCPTTRTTRPPGTTAEQVRLIDAALAQSSAGPREWGICTECGMGRVAPNDVPTLLDLHREILVSADR